MIQKPLYTFNDSSDTGIDLVPVNGTILIEDSDGSGNSRMIQLTSKTANGTVLNTSTISELIAGTVGGFKDDLSLKSTDIGSSVQGYDSTILVDGDIGTSVQAHDADTVKSDIATTFTAAQRVSATTEDNIIDFTQNNNFSLTATAADMGTPTVTGCTGQSGMIKITEGTNLTGWDALYKFKNVPDLSLSTGVIIEYFAYYIESETSIIMGRVN